MVPHEVPKAWFLLHVRRKVRIEHGDSSVNNCLKVNSLPNDKILDWSVSTTFAIKRVFFCNKISIITKVVLTLVQNESRWRRHNRFLNEKLTLV